MIVCRVFTPAVGADLRMRHLESVIALFEATGDASVEIDEFVDGLCSAVVEIAPQVVV